MKSNNEIYEEIEEKIPKVHQLKKIPIRECGDPMVCLSEEDGHVLSFHNSGEMLELLGPKMVVRASIKEMLITAGKKIYTLSPEITGKVLEQRLLLKEVMEFVGFVNFCGEFWHYSFGDREWAVNLAKDNAFYKQLTLAEVLEQI